MQNVHYIIANTKVTQLLYHTMFSFITAIHARYERGNRCWRVAAKFFFMLIRCSFKTYTHIFLRVLKTKRTRNEYVYKLQTCVTQCENRQITR